MPEPQVEMITIRSQHFAYHIHPVDMLSTNQGLSAHDLKDYDHCMLMFLSTERLRMWLLGRQSAFRDQESLNLEVNACWQQSMDGLLRKFDDLHTELEDLEKRVLEEFMIDG